MEIEKFEEEEDWMEEEIDIPEGGFLPLPMESGGKELVAFLEPPSKHKSNFTKGKSEWWFKVWHFPLYEKEGGELVPGPGVEKIISESGPNFRAQVTKISERGKTWKKPTWIKWEKVVPKVGNPFKKFKFVPFDGTVDEPKQ